MNGARTEGGIVRMRIVSIVEDARGGWNIVEGFKSVSRKMRERSEIVLRSRSTANHIQKGRGTRETEKGEESKTLGRVAFSPGWLATLSRLEQSPLGARMTLADEAPAKCKRLLDVDAVQQDAPKLT